ncbi:MAG: hypothetical protein KatS3mg015_2557 [Fimbriimonadales bacterium]|nr:MAG: hypothetical protein KatS3mg015_2557 [Fimbriimonadales bacterium]
MSVVAVGPALNLDGPLPERPLYSLLDVPGVVQDSGDARVFTGATLWGYPEEVPSLWDPCSTGTFRTKSEQSSWSRPHFDAFSAYLPVVCSTISGDPRDLARRAELVLEATLPYAVERALAQGIPQSANPYFGDANLTVLGGGAVSPSVGLSYLEDAIGQTGREGLIHAPPSVVAAWGFEKLRTDGTSLRTSAGTLVSRGGGYIGADPINEVSPAAGQSYVFATGPVHVYLDEFVLTDVSDYVDPSTNTVIYRAEMMVLAVWDTALQAGVLIDWTP